MSNLRTRSTFFGQYNMSLRHRLWPPEQGLSSFLMSSLKAWVDPKMISAQEWAFHLIWPHHFMLFSEQITTPWQITTYANFDIYRLRLCLLSQIQRVSKKKAHFKCAFFWRTTKKQKEKIQQICVCAVSKTWARGRKPHWLRLPVMAAPSETNTMQIQYKYNANKMQKQLL